MPSARQLSHAAAAPAVSGHSSAYLLLPALRRQPLAPGHQALGRRPGLLLRLGLHHLAIRPQLARQRLRRVGEHLQSMAHKQVIIWTCGDTAASALSGIYMFHGGLLKTFGSRSLVNACND